MKKKIIIILIIVATVIVGTIGTVILVKHFNRNTTHKDVNLPKNTDTTDNDKPSNETENDPNKSQLPENNQSKNIQNKLKLFGKELNSLSEVSDNDIKAHLETAMNVFLSKNYDKFTNDDITILIAYKYLVMYSEPYKMEEITTYVNNLFGVSNFQIKEGEYISPIHDNEKIVISKSGNKFVSNLGGKSNNMVNKFVSKEIKDNQVIVHYNYGYDDLNTLKFVTIGKTNVYLKLVNNNLILDKIVFDD